MLTDVNNNNLLIASTTLPSPTVVVKMTLLSLLQTAAVQIPWFVPGVLSNADVMMGFLSWGRRMRRLSVREGLVGRVRKEEEGEGKEEGRDKQAI